MIINKYMIMSSVVIWMKGLRDITSGPRSYKEGHDDYVRLTLKRACPSDEGTYCILVKNRYGCDRSFFSVQVIYLYLLNINIKLLLLQETKISIV